MKKVLLLAPMSSVHERFNIANINVLKGMQCELHIAANFETDSRARQYAENLKNSGVITHHIPFVRSSLLNNLKCIPKIRALLKSERFDMVHCHTETGGILTRLSITAAKNTKFVYTPHGMSFYKGCPLKARLIYKPIEHFICKKMAANIAMNGEELQVLNKWNRKTARFIHGIGVDIAAYKNAAADVAAKKKELGVPENAFVVLSVGELNQNKNQRVVLDALSQIPGLPDNLCCLICGEGELKAELQKTAAQKNITLVLPGYRYDMPEIFKIADIFVFPSFHEGLPVSVIQAMANGLPIVCSNIRGNVDLIENGKGGFLCNPNSAEEFAAALSKLFNSPELCRQFGAVNLENSQMYDVKNVEKETLEIYKEVLPE